LGALAPLLLVSAGAMAPPLLLLVSAGAIAGAAGGAGAAAGVALSELLHAVSITVAAARALRASFVFIDESPNCKERTRTGRVSATGDSIESWTYFKLLRCATRAALAA
jgi:hypothetical protein